LKTTDLSIKKPLCSSSATHMTVCANCRESIEAHQPFGALSCCDRLAHEACIAARLLYCSGMASFRCASCWAEIPADEWARNFKLSRKRKRG